MNIQNTQRLDELGERLIIERIFRPRYGKSEDSKFGDDCAVIVENSSNARTIVATTDPCPEPMASQLGFTDPYYRGWLLATINLSDLASVGAQPLGLLTSLILPNHTTVGQLERLLDGIDDCCHESETQVIGGNLKEGPKIDLSATAIGACESGRFLSRIGCQPGDLIVVVGDFGLFWAGVFALRYHLDIKETETSLLRNVLTPLPKVKVGRELANRKLLTACMDNSDGLYPSLKQLADSNNVQMYSLMDNLHYSPEVQFVSSSTGIEAIRFAIGWGDWQLIGCCQRERLDELRSVAKTCSTDVFVIGEVRAGDGVVLDYKGRTGLMAPIDSQRFTKDSWFTAGIESYIELLTHGSLWKE
jgi:thiamine-monophosphate kinase